MEAGTPAVQEPSHRGVGPEGSSSGDVALQRGVCGELGFFHVDVVAAVLGDHDAAAGESSCEVAMQVSPESFVLLDRPLGWVLGRLAVCEHDGRDVEVVAPFLPQEPLRAGDIELLRVEDRRRERLRLGPQTCECVRPKQAREFFDPPDPVVECDGIDEDDAVDVGGAVT